MNNRKYGKTMKLVLGLLAVMMVMVGLLGCSNAAGQQSTAVPVQTGTVTKAPATAAEPSGSKDLAISVGELSQKPQFYATEVNGTKMEVIALLASDGTVRTAFNTCQVCYSSGRGYYKADGNELVCQNCGNRFTGDAVGMKKGGCNPVPITEKDRSEKDGVITVPGDFLSQASVIFANWKK